MPQICVDDLWQAPDDCGSELGACSCVLLQDELLAGEDIARCPSCSLFIQVIYDQVTTLQCFS